MVIKLTRIDLERLLILLDEDEVESVQVKWKVVLPKDKIPSLEELRRKELQTFSDRGFSIYPKNTPLNLVELMNGSNRFGIVKGRVMVKTNKYKSHLTTVSYVYADDVGIGRTIELK